MKVFRNKLTGRLGETQFKENAEILIKNAKSAGFKDEEIEIIDMTPKEYMELIAIQNENDKTPEQKREEKIREEMDRILREQAITNLKAKGEL